jgi:hypothetical protein
MNTFSTEPSDVEPYLANTGAWPGPMIPVLSGWILLIKNCRIPPPARTATRMQGMKWRVIRFAVAHGHPPATVDELPATPGFDNSVRDGW